MFASIFAEQAGKRLEEEKKRLAGLVNWMTEKIGINQEGSSELYDSDENMGITWD